MKIRNIFETVFGFGVMGISVYLHINMPSEHASIAIYIVFAVGFVGSLAPYITSVKNSTAKSFFKTASIGLHVMASICLLVGIISTYISGSGLGIIFALMLSSFIYTFASGLKSLS